MNLRTVLEYSPYDNKRISPFSNNGDKEKNRSEFKEKFFVDYSKYTKDNLDNTIQQVIKGNKNMILFFGASGCGKTTYLNYFVNSYSEDFVFHIVNLIEDATSIDYYRCIRETIINRLCELLDEESNGVTKELYRRIVVDGSYIPFELEEDNRIFINYLVKALRKGDGSFAYIKKIGLYDEEGNEIIKYSNEKLLALYLLSELLSSSNDLSTDTKHVFIFDNLDEVPTQYISPAIYDMILSAYSDVQLFCEKSSEYNFLQYCTFVLSFRSTNAQILDSTQHQERLFMAQENIEFGSKYQVPYNDILKKRMEYYFANEKESPQIESIAEAMELLNTEKDYCDKVIRPLFNYDYRMYTNLFLANLFRKNFNNVDKSLIKTDESEVRSNTAVQTGARGVLIFNALESMMSYNSSRFMNYVRHEFEDDTLCNVYRMSFTLLSNLGGWSITEDYDLQKALKDENDFNDGTPRISLYKFVDKIEKWYGKDLVDTAIEGLLGSTAYNFEYPLVLIGGKVDSYYSDSANKHTTSGLAHYIVGLYNENKNTLSNIYMKINPLCVLYSWRIFINFEYFNLISTRWDNEIIREYRYTPTPLFLINNDYMLENCLRSVFLTVKHILNMADRHFCDKCVESNRAGCQYKRNNKNLKRKDVQSSVSTCSKSFSNFIEDGFCVQNSLYATRLITSHINYLERYRRFIRDKIKDNEKAVKMQLIVIRQMEQYIKLWEEGRVVTSQKLFEQYKRAINYVTNKMHENPFVEMESNPDSVEANDNQVDVNFHKGNYDQSIEDYNKAIELNPQDATAYNNRGIAYSNKGDNDQAIKDYDRAIELNPQDATTYNNRGFAYSNKGDYDQAIKDYDKAIGLNPQDATAYNNRGLAYDYKGDNDQAIKDYDEAIGLNPQYATAFYNRGVAYSNKGDNDQAIKDYDKAIELNPQYAKAYINRGVAYSDKGIMTNQSRIMTGR